MSDTYYSLKIGSLSTGARLIGGRIAGFDLNPFTDTERTRAVDLAEQTDGCDIIHMEITESGGPIGDGLCLAFYPDCRRDLVDAREGKPLPLAAVWLDFEHVKMLHAALGAAIKMYRTMERFEDKE